MQRPSVTLFSSPIVSSIWAPASTIIEKSQSGSKQADGMGTGASTLRWADCSGAVGIFTLPPGENVTRVIDDGALPWPWFCMTIRNWGEAVISQYASGPPKLPSGRAIRSGFSTDSSGVMHPPVVRIIHKQQCIAIARCAAVLGDPALIRKSVTALSQSFLQPHYLRF